MASQRECRSLLGCICILSVFACAGCANRVSVPTGISARELHVLRVEHSTTARFLNMQKVLRQAEETEDYRAFRRQVEQRSDEIAWSLGYYQIYSNRRVAERRDAVFVSALLLYASRDGSIGFITNVPFVNQPEDTELWMDAIRGTVPVNELRLSSRPWATESAISELRQKLIDQVRQAPAGPLTIDPEGTRFDTESCDTTVIEMRGPAGASFFAGINSLEPQMYWEWMGNTPASAAAFDIMKLWHEMLNLGCLKEPEDPYGLNESDGSQESGVIDE